MSILAPSDSRAPAVLRMRCQPPTSTTPNHTRDLVNVEVNDGIGYMKHTTNRVTLSPGPLTLGDFRRIMCTISLAFLPTFCVGPPVR